MFVMRDYQQDVINELYMQWATGKRFGVVVMPTGSGKAAVLCEVVRLESERGQALLVTAHRSELISQLSTTLAKFGIAHNIIAAKPTIKYSIRRHMEETGQAFYNPESRVTVASVQSVKDRDVERLKQYGSRLTLVGDEFHHYTRGSKTWGGVFTPLDEAGAKGVGLTATPQRADGKGLSRETDGYGDFMVLGPTMREMIDQGFLVDYKIWAPPSDLHLENVAISATTGDYKERELKAEMSKSRIVGDIVGSYLKFAPGLRGVTFTVGVDMAEEVAEAYRARGVPATAVSGRMKDHERVQAMRDIQSGKILQLVNDSVLTEGTDIPSLEVISFAKPTESVALYHQMFGRGTRTSPGTGKKFLRIIDHVGNVMRHRGPPDIPRIWTLDRAEKRRGSASEPLTTRVCLACTASFERFRDCCPECGEPIPAPAGKSSPEQVDGDLTELDPRVLNQLRAEAQAAMMDAGAYRDQQSARGVPQIGVKSQVDKHIARKEALEQLQNEMVNWLGYQFGNGLSESERYRKFYITFGIDWESAKSLKKDAANQLAERIRNVPNY